VEFQPLRKKMETEWIPQLQLLLDIPRNRLPVIWDADFLLGPENSSGEDTYILCEINVSSVFPLPDSAVPFIVKSTMEVVA
jgi:hypothetical protein